MSRVPHPTQKIKISTPSTLPGHITALIIRGGLSYGYGRPAIEAGLQAARVFQAQTAWRCGACHRWMDAVNLPLCCLTEHEIVFVAVCPRCERKHPTDAALRRAIAGYVGEEGRP